MKVFPGVFFLADHLHHLPTPLQGRVKKLLVPVRHRAGLGPQGRGEGGQDLSLAFIGFGWLPGALGEVPPRLGIDQDHRQLGLGKGWGYQKLLAAGGLQDAELGFEGYQAFDHLLDAPLVVRG